jgi:HAE1 family hydrophobic/amphiphilic exporter-1
MFFSALVLFGIIASFKIKIDLLPPIEYPEVSVITLYGGAAPKEIENLVSRPIEEIISTVPGVRSVRSESIEGASLVVASLNWGADMDMAGLRIREKVDLIRGSLPQDADRSIVARFDPNSQPITGQS